MRLAGTGGAPGIGRLSGFVRDTHSVSGLDDRAEDNTRRGLIFRFSYERSEYASLYRYLALRLWLFWACGLLGVGLVALAIGGGASGLTTPGVALLAVPALYLLGPQIFPAARRRARYPHEVRLDADTFTMVTELGETKVPWGKVSSVVLHKGMYLLMLGPHRAYGIPSRSLGDSAADFTALVESKGHRIVPPKAVGEPATEQQRI